MLNTADSAGYIDFLRRQRFSMRVDTPKQDRNIFFKTATTPLFQPGASDAVLIGGAQPPEINASDLTATPYVLEEAFTRAGSFSS